MDLRPSRIFPLGDNAVTVEFGTELSECLNMAAVSLADHFEKNPFPGFVEAVPAIASTTIFYRPADVPKSGAGESSYYRVKRLIERASVTASEDENPRNTITVPVSFSTRDALDLDSISGHAHLPSEEVIDTFLAGKYRVYMVGFLPGFAYMGKVNELIAAPRLATPRTSVPKGSVGIAGLQTGIYPSSSPGGWQIIGRTQMDLLRDDPLRPCIFAPGDRVQFVRADT